MNFEELKKVVLSHFGSGEEQILDLSTEQSTALLIIINDVLSAYEKNFYETKEKLESLDDPNALITFEIRKVKNGCNEAEMQL